jgi:hypothetical protein
MSTIKFLLIFELLVNMILVTLVLLHIILKATDCYKKVLSFCTMDFSHTAQIIYQYIINVLQEYNLKSDLENKLI